MKMIRRTRTTSMKGTMLISESEDWVDFGSVGMGVRSLVRSGEWRVTSGESGAEKSFHHRGHGEH
jgi:hypothetical protein